MNRVAFYIDGFNFYYGLSTAGKKDAVWKKFYWIDVVKLFGSFLNGEQQLSKVVYFTASPLDADKSSRQSSFLNANKVLNEDIFEVVRGKYIEKPIHCPFCHNDFMRPEEKKTDVNISVRMQIKQPEQKPQSTGSVTFSPLRVYSSLQRLNAPPSRSSLPPSIYLRVGVRLGVNCSVPSS